MATATLELINPYSKLGLKRRPTYDEIINLINENETITGQLPDRTATLYKASPEGSFFDGTDALELLKEQQNRILQRQMQDLLLRQTVRSNGGTFFQFRKAKTKHTIIVIIKQFNTNKCWFGLWHFESSRNANWIARTSKTSNVKTATNRRSTCWTNITASKASNTG